MDPFVIELGFEWGVCEAAGCVGIHKAKSLSSGEIRVVRDSSSFDVQALFVAILWVIHTRLKLFGSSYYFSLVV